MEATTQPTALRGDTSIIATMLIASLVLTVLAGTLLPGLPFTVVFCAVVAVFSYFQVDLFLFAVIFLLPLSPVVSTGLPLHNVSTLIQLSMFVGFVVRAILKKESLRKSLVPPGIARTAAVFILLTLLCTVVLRKPTTSSLRACSELFAGFCFFLVLSAWVKRESQVRTILCLIMSSGILVACFGFYQAIVDDYSSFYFWLYPKQADILEPWTGRITSVLNYSNSLAGFINLIVPIALGFLLIPFSKRIRLLAGISLATSAAALLLTASRGGLASFLAMLLLAAIYVTRQARSRKWLLILGLATAAVGLILIFGVIRTPWAAEDESAAMRLLFWGVAAALFLASPVIGIGYGNFRDLYNLPGIAPGVFDVHNLYLQLLAETGLVGFIAFGATIILVVRKCMRTLRHPERNLGTIVNFAALGAVVALLLHGFVDFLFIVSPQFTALFWVILAMVVVVDRWPKAQFALRSQNQAAGTA